MAHVSDSGSAEATRFIHQATSTPGLPTEILNRAARRLGWLAIIYGAVHAVYLLLPASSQAAADALTNITEIAMIAVSLGMFGLTRVPTIAPARIITLGLVFEVIGAIGIEIPILSWTGGWWEGATTIWIMGISWTCVWIVIFPLVAPSSPRRVVIAALAAASVRPVLLALAVAGGAPEPEWMIALYWIIPNYICVGIALLSAYVVFGMGQAVAKARHLGSYQLKERLGEGGMGEVWRGEHRMLARPAAIKLIRPEAFGRAGENRQQLVRRFEREAQATARLSSPHTVRLYDYGVSRDGILYYVMELLRGIDLDQLVRRFGPVPPERTVHILKQVCNSIAEAHEAGLVHRDIKPANIVLCRIGIDHDYVKVLDFGLVTGRLFGDGREASLTADNTVAGTPAYMAPEMVKGETVDGRADIYAVGCLTHWLLTGRPVFDGNSAMNVALAQVNDPPTPPSQLSEFTIPPELDAMVLQCLEKSPEDRPASASDMLAALNRMPLGNAWTSADADDWWDRHQPVPPQSSSETSLRNSAVTTA